MEDEIEGALDSEMIMNDSRTHLPLAQLLPVCVIPINFVASSFVQARVLKQHKTTDSHQQDLLPAVTR